MVKKLVAEKLAKISEANEKLHKSQMGARKNRSAIYATAILVQKVQDIWKKGQIAETLRIDVKDAFDHVSRAKQTQKIDDFGINDNLIG